MNTTMLEGNLFLLDFCRSVCLSLSRGKLVVMYLPLVLLLADQASFRLLDVRVD
jgi:hypothetical protein